MLRAYRGDGMTVLQAIAYAAYLAWLLAGLLDFACHRRANLPHTSGLAESVLHMVQLGLIGAGGVLGLAFAPGRALLAVLLAIVLVHAVVGYLDTRTAFGRRTLSPAEQHIHSVLDMAPWIAFACWVASGWPAIAAGGWHVQARTPAIEAGWWAALLLPALLLCGVPAVSELRASLRARRAARGQ